MRADIFEIYVPEWFIFNPHHKQDKVYTWSRLQASLWQSQLFNGMMLESRALLMLIYSVCCDRRSDRVSLSLHSVASGLRIRTDVLYSAINELIQLEYIKVSFEGSEVKVLEFKGRKKSSQRAAKEQPNSINTATEEQPKSIQSASEVQDAGIDNPAESFRHGFRNYERTYEQTTTNTKPVVAIGVKPSMRHSTERYEDRFKEEHPDTQKFRDWLELTKCPKAEPFNEASLIMKRFRGWDRFVLWRDHFVKTNPSFESKYSDSEKRDYLISNALLEAGLRERKPNAKGRE